MTERKAVLVGASGMVGGFCLKILLESPQYASVVVLLRRELVLPKDVGGTQQKLTQKIVDFDHLSPADFAGANDIFCALGTTMRKAGSQEEFLRVDLEYPLMAAKHALAAGATRFILVSSAGARAAAKNFYLHTKGELEDKLTDLGYSSLHIFRPGLLLGKREEVRPGEQFATRIAPLFNLTLWGPMRHYRSISAEKVGKAMVTAAVLGASGTNIYEFDAIEKLAELAGTQPSASYR